MTIQIVVVCVGMRNFNSHPHKEDDVDRCLSYPEANHFNSHPHKEDDLCLSDCCLICSISTHILTRRMTQSHLRMDFSNTHFNSHPHKEDDIFYIYSRRNVNISTHILTRRMTFAKCFSCYISSYFNSHPHKEDDFLLTSLFLFGFKFQLTSSQGG